PAEGGGGHAQQGIGRRLDERVLDCLDGDLAQAANHDRSHASSSRLAGSRRCRCRERLLPRPWTAAFGPAAERHGYGLRPQLAPREVTAAPKITRSSLPVLVWFTIPAAFLHHSLCVLGGPAADHAGGGPGVAPPAGSGRAPG